MRAIIKKTGEVIEIDEHNISLLDYARGRYIDMVSRKKYKECELDFLEGPNRKPIDWEQRRYELAQSAMNGILSNEHEVCYACSDREYEKIDIHTMPKIIARYAVACADALIAELKEECK